MQALLDYDCTHPHREAGSDRGVRSKTAAIGGLTKRGAHTNLPTARQHPALPDPSKSNKTPSSHEHSKHRHIADGSSAWIGLPHESSPAAAAGPARKSPATTEAGTRNRSLPSAPRRRAASDDGLQVGASNTNAAYDMRDTALSVAVMHTDMPQYPAMSSGAGLTSCAPQPASLAGGYHTTAAAVECRPPLKRPRGWQQEPDYTSSSGHASIVAQHGGAVVHGDDSTGAGAGAGAAGHDHHEEDTDEDEGSDCSWDSVIGMESAKSALWEALMLPLLFPAHVLTGVRKVPNTVLLYGPPGTGKTALVRAAAAASRRKVFAITPATVLSKWAGEGEKALRAVFHQAGALCEAATAAADASRRRALLQQVLPDVNSAAVAAASNTDASRTARHDEHQEAEESDCSPLPEPLQVPLQVQVPAGAIIFIDECDALAPSRDGLDDLSARRLLNELLLLMTEASRRPAWRSLLVVAATNRESDLDPALLRRFDRRIFCPLPDLSTRLTMITRWMLDCVHVLNEDDCYDIAGATEGWNGADLRNLCCEAAMRPLRQAAAAVMGNASGGAMSSGVPWLPSTGPSAAMVSGHMTLQPVNRQDFEAALEVIKPTDWYYRQAGDEQQEQEAGVGYDEEEEEEDKAEGAAAAQEMCDHVAELMTHDDGTAMDSSGIDSSTASDPSESGASTDSTRQVPAATGAAMTSPHIRALRGTVGAAASPALDTQQEERVLQAWRAVVGGLDTGGVPRSQPHQLATSRSPHIAAAVPNMHGI